MRKILRVFIGVLFLQATAHSQLHIENAGNLYTEWLSTAEAPTNKLNLKLKSKTERDAYQKEEAEYIKENKRDYEPHFYREWQSTIHAPANWQNFHLKPKKEQLEYANKVNKWFERFNPGFLAFNLTTLQEPLLKDDMLKREEAKIKTSLVECSRLIGPGLWEDSIIKKYRRI